MRRGLWPIPKSSARKAADLWLADAVPEERGAAGAVTPASATESPWLARSPISGMSAARRRQARERGTVYFHQCTAELEHANCGGCGHLHDRMTESIWIDSVIPKAFHMAAAACPLLIVNLGADGTRLCLVPIAIGTGAVGDEIDTVAAFRHP